MITHVREHAARGPSYASGGEPGWTEVRWECDRCNFSGEWDDHPYREDGSSHTDPQEGQEAYCETCATAMHPEEDTDA